MLRPLVRAYQTVAPERQSCQWTSMVAKIVWRLRFHAWIPGEIDDDASAALDPDETADRFDFECVRERSQFIRDCLRNDKMEPGWGVVPPRAGLPYEGVWGGHDG